MAHLSLLCLTWLSIYLTLIVAKKYKILPPSQEIKDVCSGPIGYYEALGCEKLQVFTKDNARRKLCGTEYHCDKARNISKCFFWGEEYEIGEMMKPKHEITCQSHCTCIIGTDGIATFDCKSGRSCCYELPANSSYYFENTPTSCCSGPMVYDKELADYECIVDNLRYKIGEFFTPKVFGMQNYRCVCLPGFPGVRADIVFFGGYYTEADLRPPFCRAFNRPYCTEALYYRNNIFLKNCAPVYDIHDIRLDLACVKDYRCQSHEDYVIHLHFTTKSDDEVCIFGNLELHIGDELNRQPLWSGGCVKCICEVPPAVTCAEVTKEECEANITYDRVDWPWTPHFFEIDIPE